MEQLQGAGGGRRRGQSRQHNTDKTDYDIPLFPGARTSYYNFPLRRLPCLTFTLVTLSLTKRDVNVLGYKARIQARYIAVRFTAPRSGRPSDYWRGRAHPAREPVPGANRPPAGDTFPELKLSKEGRRHTKPFNLQTVCPQVKFNGGLSHRCAAALFRDSDDGKLTSSIFSHLSWTESAA